MADYKQLEIRAAEGLHEDSMNLVTRYASPSCQALDVAAGEGAFSMRLHDAGFSVTANDIDEKEWQPTHIRKLKLDLNEPIDGAIEPESIPLVVAMEVIEHLQNPMKLLKDCARLVSKDGIILLTTPNVLDLESRLVYLRSGFVFHISPQSYTATGHCVILPDWLLETFIANAGLEIVEKQWSGVVPTGQTTSFIKRFLKALLKKLIAPLIRVSDREILTANNVIYVLRRSRD